jgi:hypothetical protein
VGRGQEACKLGFTRTTLGTDEVSLERRRNIT